MTNLDSILKSSHYFANKGPSSQGYGFSNSHVWIWELDYKESWALKNRCFWTVVLEKILESPLDCKEIQPVHPKGGQSWVYIGRTDVEAETPILWPPDAKNWLIWKDPDAGKDWSQEEKRTTEDEMVGWHHWLNGHGFGGTPGVGDGQGGLPSCGPWDHKEPDTTGQLNWTELNWYSPWGGKQLDMTVPLTFTFTTALFTLKVCFSEATFMNCLSRIFWLTCCSAYTAPASPYTFMLWRQLLSLNPRHQTLLVSHFSSAASSPLSAFRKFKS